MLSQAALKGSRSTGPRHRDDVSLGPETVAALLGPPLGTGLGSASAGYLASDPYRLVIM